jgi:hypothetical protein
MKTWGMDEKMNPERIAARIKMRLRPHSAPCKRTLD